ncbi:hypothetical protein L6452_37958 [Arctium lappa]|uniref:Uncharacterized protein n=1 Tax=Arctium lappa TaxID=4217 RepID=A0ACB8Y537_ARCLA|nr:hypothetical protein L6452_37958 [Arctium lappa]
MTKLPTGSWNSANEAKNDVIMMLTKEKVLETIIYLDGGGRTVVRGGRTVVRGGRTVAEDGRNDEEERDVSVEESSNAARVGNEEAEGGVTPENLSGDLYGLKNGASGGRFREKNVSDAYGGGGGYRDEHCGDLYGLKNGASGGRFREKNVSDAYGGGGYRLEKKPLDP